MPKFKYNQPVNIAGGFYVGQRGVVIAVQRRFFRYRYVVKIEGKESREQIGTFSFVLPAPPKLEIFKESELTEAAASEKASVVKLAPMVGES